MFPMDEHSTMFPVMMGIMAGQQVDQQRLLEEQNALLEEQAWWAKWRDPLQQQVLIDWFMQASGDELETWNHEVWSLPTDRYEYLIAIVRRGFKEAPAEQQAAWNNRYNNRSSK